MPEYPEHTRARFVLPWIALLAAALLLDGPVARAMVPWHLTIKHSELAEELKEGGHVGITCIAMLLVLTLDSRKWRAVSLIGIGALLVGSFRYCTAFAVGRTRPVVRIAPFEFAPFSGGIDGVLTTQNLSFPSGHASLAFATAAALSYLLPKGRWLFFGGAVLVGLERIAENAHYVSDVVGAAMLGVFSFKCALAMNQWLWDRIDRGAESLPLQSAPPRLAE